MKKGHTYVIKNTINDKVYVGQTLEFRKSGKFGYLKRFTEHKCSAKNNPKYYLIRS